MRRWGWLVLAGAVGLGSTAVMGCDDGEDASDAMVVVIDIDNGLADLGAGGTGGMADMTVNPREDMGAGGMGGAGGTGGGGGIRDIETCPEICAVYETCGRVDDIWSGSFDACQAACEAGTANERFNGYRACMQITPCERLEECVVPARPLPGCQDVCAAAEACEDAPRAPAGLPEFADCAAACDDGVVARYVAQCGQSLVDDGVCDEPTFSRCIVDLRAADCVQVCEARADCDDTVDIVDCALACEQPVEDALGQRRNANLNGCLRSAADCDAVAACEANVLPPAVGVDELCAANAASDCGFFEAETCAEVADAAVRPLAEGAVPCLTAGLTECETPMVRCFQTAPPPADGCRDHCEFSALCGLLEQGATELDCRTACQNDAAEGERTDHWQGLFECTRSATCVDLETCQAAGSAEARCADFCASQGACAGEGFDADACAIECGANFGTRRAQGELACVAAAGSCEAAARCDAPPAPDCSVVCDPQVACQIAEADACQVQCDDAEFADPAGFLPLATCINAGARCSAQRTCLEGDLSGANACLAWCAQRTTCAGEGDLAACALECAREGVVGQDGLVFAAAEACLVDADRADCAALDACVDVAPGDYCDPLCAEQVRCGLAEDAAACVADCAANGAVEPAVCALNAVRREAGCAPVAECLGVMVEPASDACVALCASQNLCDEGQDRFLCERECVPEPEGTPVRSVCAGYANCEQLPMCLEADGVVPEGCDAACATVAACDGLLGAGDGAVFADAATCALECGGRAVLEGADYAGAVGDCVAGAACGAEPILGCFESPANLCDVALEAVVACGIADFVAADPAQFLIDCNNNLVMDQATTETQIQCLVDSAPDGLACTLCLIGGVGP